MTPDEFGDMTAAQALEVASGGSAWFRGRAVVKSTRS